MRYRGYRRRPWRRGIVGFPFGLILIFIVFSHAGGGMLIGIGIIFLLIMLVRFILPAIFGAGMMNSWWMNNQQAYRQQQYTPQPYEQAYNPSEENYQSYEQGYQPQTVTYEADAEKKQYQPPAYEPAQYEEQPQAQYPQEMPPMEQ
jgi:hypothetical protein